MLIIVPEEVDCNLKPEKAFSSGWYLHGELENKFGFDLAYPLNLISMGYVKDTIDWVSLRGNVVDEIRSENPRPTIHINGIIPVKCFGTEEPCIGYFWTVDERDIIYEGNKYPFWRQRGLVCLESDVKAREHAQKKYQEKSRFL